MNEAFSRLEEVLVRLTELHARLLMEADAKRTAIIEGDIDAMEQSLARERELVVLVEAAELDRQAAVETLRAGLGLGEGPLKLTAIIEAADTDWAGRLRAVHVRLKDVVEKLRYRSRQNAELLKASMEHVESFLRALAEACAPKKGYGRDGRAQAGPVSLLDRSA